MSRAKVLEVCPTAGIERHRTTGFKTYYLVRRRGAFMYIAEGSTPGEAWRNAWERLLPRLRIVASSSASDQTIADLFKDVKP